MPSSLPISIVLTILCFCIACDQKSGGVVSAGGKTSTDGAPVPQELAIVGFYNVENLFDTIDDPDNSGDDEFLPNAAKRWTAQRYEGKLARLASAIAEMGSTSVIGGPALLGLAEVENERVLRDLITQPALAKSRYDIIHYDSPDRRGIDVGLVYRTELFQPLHSAPLRVSLGMDEDSRERITRDVLYVKGLLLGDTLHVLINHWPSRRGGEEASRPDRAVAASVVRAAVDSIRERNAAAGVILLGDFNDDPTDASLTVTLRAAETRGDAALSGLYNPMVSTFRRGEGTLVYRNNWNLFDQVIVSAGLVENGPDWTLADTRIVRAPYLLQSGGRYDGYPSRTFVGDRYLGGYSDHLPVYAILSRPKA